MPAHFSHFFLLIEKKNKSRNKFIKAHIYETLNKNPKGHHIASNMRGVNKSNLVKKRAVWSERHIITMSKIT